MDDYYYPMCIFFDYSYTSSGLTIYFPSLVALQMTFHSDLQMAQF